MNFLLFLMGNPSDPSSSYMNLIFIGLIFVVFYFFIIRPQNKKQKEIQEKVTNLEKGDKVVTSGGMMGNCASVDDDTVLLEIDKNVKARFLKSAITDVNPHKNDD